MVKIKIEEYDDVIRLYNNGLFVSKIASIYSVSTGTIYNILKKYNTPIRKDVRQSQFSEDDKQKMFNLYDDGFSLNEIGQILGFNASTIRSYFKKNNKKCRDNSKSHRKYQLDENFFDIIDTSEKAYVVGLLFADGYNDIKHGKVSLGLQERDKHILEEIKVLLKSNIPLYFCKSKSDKHQNTYKLVIHSTHVSRALESLGMRQAKSLILEFPAWLDHTLYSSFLRGYFDGDGWLSERQYDYAFNIVSTEKFCKVVQNILNDMNITTTICYTYNKESATRVLKSCNKENTKKFLDYIYKDATIYLHRKYNIYQAKYLLNNTNNSLSA